jgi:hypothetical protein
MAGGNESFASHQKIKTLPDKGVRERNTGLPAWGLYTATTAYLDEPSYLKICRAIPSGDYR